jgi:hypothetical protein
MGLPLWPKESDSSPNRNSEPAHMIGYIELKDENGTYRITREIPPALDDLIEDLVIPVLLAAGYSRSAIDNYYSKESCPGE